MAEINFTDYKDPEKARRIWKEYLPELSANGLLDFAINAIRERKCSTAIDLELILDNIITSASQLRQIQGASSSRFVEDIDADGYISNAKKCLED